MSDTDNWLNFHQQMHMINDLFSNGCFVAAHTEAQRLEKFLAIFARREMAKEERKKNENKPA